MDETPRPPRADEIWNLVDDSTDEPPPQVTETMTPSIHIHDTTSYSDLVAALADDTAQRAAAAWLFRHAYYTAQRPLLRECGAVEALTRLAQSATSDYYSQLYALGCLSSLESKRQPFARTATPAELEKLHEAIDSEENDNARVEAVAMVYCLHQVGTNAVELAEFVPQLVALLTDANTRLSSAAAETLCGLAQEHASSIADHGAVPLLIELVRSGDRQQKERAANALAILATNDRNVPALAFTGGALEPLLELMRFGVGEQKLSAALALGALVEHDPDRQRAAIEIGALAPLFDLLRDGNAGEQEEAFGALRTMTIATPEMIALQVETLRGDWTDMTKLLVLALVHKAVEGDGDPASKAIASSKAAFVKGGIVVPLVELLRRGSPDASIVAATVLAELVENHDIHKIAVLDADAVAPLVAIVREDPKPLVMLSVIPRKAQALRAICHLAHENGLCKLRLAQAGALPVLLEIVRTGHEPNERALAATALAHLTTSNEAYAVEVGLLGALGVLVDFARTSVESNDQLGVVSALSALCALSACKHNQDTILGLGIRGLLSETEGVSATTQVLAMRLRRHLGLQSTAAAQGVCIVM